MVVNTRKQKHLNFLGVFSVALGVPMILDTNMARFFQAMKQTRIVS